VQYPSGLDRNFGSVKNENFTAESRGSGSASVQHNQLENIKNHMGLVQKDGPVTVKEEFPGLIALKNKSNQLKAFS